MIYITNGNIQLTSEACSVHRPISLQTVLYIEKMADCIKALAFSPLINSVSVLTNNRSNQIALLYAQSMLKLQSSNSVTDHWTQLVGF